MSDTHDNNRRWWVLGDHRLRAGVRIAAVGRRTSRDLFGRKWTFISGAVGFAVASAAGGAAQSFGWLVIARAAQGCSAPLSPGRTG